MYEMVTNVVYAVCRIVQRHNIIFWRLVYLSIKYEDIGSDSPDWLILSPKVGNSSLAPLICNCAL